MGSVLYCRTYELGDLDRLTATAVNSQECEDLIAACQVGAVGWTVTKGRDVVACAFIQFIAKDHANLAAMLDRDLTRRDWAVMTRFVRAKFRHLAAAGVRQISATVRYGVPAASAYLERFGFVKDDSFEPIPGYFTMTRRAA